MSSNEAEEDARLYECVRKYQIIIKQFGELSEMMATRSKQQRRRKSTKLSGNPPEPSSSSNQQENNDEFVQKITKFLHELRSPSPTSDPDHNQA